MSAEMFKLACVMWGICAVAYWLKGEYGNCMSMVCIIMLNLILDRFYSRN